jgi:antibiotic biosynthesis monooxygenase (ABM) superfamily enzyme
VEGVAHKSDRTSEKTNMETKIENQGEQLDPVTIVFARDVKPDRVDEFEQWVKDIREVVRQFEGYQGMDVIRPGDHAHPEYVIVLRFDDYPCLRAWMASPEREEWVQKSKPLTIGETFIQEAHGFEPWFTLPEHHHAPNPPAKYKMAALTILAIYPLLMIVSTVLGYLLNGIVPRPLIILMTVLILVPLMTYYVMPWVTGLFRGWLYPAPE